MKIIGHRDLGLSSTKRGWLDEIRFEDNSLRIIECPAEIVDKAYDACSARFQFLVSALSDIPDAAIQLRALYDPAPEAINNESTGRQADADSASSGKAAAINAS